MSKKKNVHALILKHTLLLKNANHYLTMQGCHKSSICKTKQTTTTKNAIPMKHDKAECSKMMYAYDYGISKLYHSLYLNNQNSQCRIKEI